MGVDLPNKEIGEAVYKRFVVEAGGYELKREG